MDCRCGYYLQKYAARLGLDKYSFDSQLPYGVIVYLQPELVFIYTAACFATANGLYAIDVLDYCLNITLPERLNYAGTKIVRRKISRV